MSVYTLYRQSGEIVSILTCPDDLLDLNKPEGCSAIEGEFSPFDYFIQDGVAVPKSEMVLTVSGFTVSGLPIPCTAQVESVVYQITDGVFELEANLPGPYRITFKALAYRDQIVVLQ